MKTNHLVISYDSDEQQFYYDIVRTEDEDSAVEKVLAVRDYCIGADAVDLTTMRTHLACMENWSPANVRRSWQRIVKAHEVSAL